MNYESFTIEQLKEIAEERSRTQAYFWNEIRSLRKKVDIIARFHTLDEQVLRLNERRDKEKAQEEAHKAARCEGPPRQQETVDVECLEYPFSFLRNGEYERVCNPIPGQPQEDIGTFPDNIAHSYWVSPGENDEKPWLVLCRLTNDIYVFYKGECDYTGFDCQGHMKIYASRDPNILLKFAMCSTDYDAYMKETK
jgi:hypothetical protein